MREAALARGRELIKTKGSGGIPSPRETFLKDLVHHLVAAMFPRHDTL